MSQKEDDQLHCTPFSQLNQQLDEVVSIYILHGVMGQQKFDSFFKCNIQFIKTYKIFLS